MARNVIFFLVVLGLAVSSVCGELRAEDTDSAGAEQSRATSHDFWAFQPPTRHVPRAVEKAGWARRPIDNFVLAELERHGLSPAPPAGKRTLIRRVTFDLIGLPPAPEDVRACLGVLELAFLAQGVSTSRVMMFSDRSTQDSCQASPA